MSDVEMADGPPPGLFFAGSDDEEEEDDLMSAPLRDPDFLEGILPRTPSKSTGEEGSKRSGLFLSDSEDGDFSKELKQSLDKLNQDPTSGEPDDAQSDNHSDFTGTPRASSVSSCSSSHEPRKFSDRPAKKRRLSPPRGEQPVPSSIQQPLYIGELLIADAWSTTSGKNIIKPGDPIKVLRDREPDNPKPSISKPATTSGKKTNGKKQLSIATMLKPSTNKNLQKKVDTIVRIVNSRGSEFGRLPKDASSWIAKLLDFGIAEIRGTMTDCPEKLTTGVTLIITLRVYLLPSAFKPPKTSGREDTTKLGFHEGMETEEERMLRERKTSVLRLFKAVGLKPRAGANFKGKKAEEKLHAEAMKRLADRGGKKITEIVGDGEEIEVEDAEDLSKNDIDMIYKKAQHNDKTMGEMEPAESFNLTLRGYQKQALLWMYSLETGKMDARESTAMHPLWSEYVFPGEPDEIIDLTVDDKPFYFNPYSGELSLVFPKAERDCRGGILADVGMGKTIMLSALIQTSLHNEKDVHDNNAAHAKPQQLKLDNAFKAVANKSKPRKLPSATLIVAPTSLLSQWSEEMQRSSKPGSVKALVWHGQNRLDLDAAIAPDDENDKTIKVVITSYGVLASEHAKSEKSFGTKSPIYEIEWLRVVLDEAHSCKSRSSKTAKSVYALQAQRRWAVTGTPIVNKLEDLYSLLKFLDFKPWSVFSFFRSFITIPFLARDPKAIEIVQVILESILLRREKNMRDSDGKRIVELPAKEVTVEHLEFSVMERKIYDSIYVPMKRDFDQLIAKGLVSRNYTHILAMLMRLRRAVLHPNLVLQGGNDSQGTGNRSVNVNDLIKRFAGNDDSAEGTTNNFAAHVLANLTDNDAMECPICFDVIESPMVIPNCMHQFCKDCILAHLVTCEEKDQKATCPSCAVGPINKNDLIEVVRRKTDPGEMSGSQQSEPEITLRRNDFHYSTKLEALVKDLKRLRDQDPCFRAVVFSQFTSFLDLIQIVLQRERFEYNRFDGTMDVKKKSAAITEFKSTTRKPKVLIVSLKAGGVGLNLTTANYVFLMDCWWNAAIENQAIDRVHRIGQEKTVYVKHFIIANTIEDRILKIQQRKTAIVKEAFRGPGKNKDGKEDPESIENLKIMFEDI